MASCDPFCRQEDNYEEDEEVEDVDDVESAHSDDSLEEGNPIVEEAQARMAIMEEKHPDMVARRKHSSMPDDKDEAELMEEEGSTMALNFCRAIFCPRANCRCQGGRPMVTFRLMIGCSLVAIMLLTNTVFFIFQSILQRALAEDFEQKCGQKLTASIGETLTPEVILDIRGFVSQTIQGMLLYELLVVLIALGIMCLVAIFMGCMLSRSISRPLRRTSKFMRRLRLFNMDQIESDRTLSKTVGDSHIIEVGMLQRSFDLLAEAIQLFACFVPAVVVKNILTGEKGATSLHVTKRNVTIMFSAIRDFSTISEQLPEESLLLLLTLYLDVMTQIVESHNGVVAEILGDGLLAFWNTPDDVSDHALKAVSAAIEKQRALEALNQEFRDLGFPEISMEMGLNSGDVLSGIFGSQTKMKFGCMGDPVNLASRTLGLCKYYGVGVVCAESTRHAASASAPPDCPQFGFRHLDLVQVKGRREPTQIFEVLDSRHLTPELQGAVRLYESALQAFQRGDLFEAKRLAEQLRRQRPGDKAVEKLLERCKETVPPDKRASWTGVNMMTDK